MDFSTRKALKILDKERGDNKNELYKLIVNVPPFDEILTEMREKARVPENLKDVEGELVALVSSESFKTATQILMVPMPCPQWRSCLKSLTCSAEICQ